MQKQLNKFQQNTLEKLANGDVKLFTVEIGPDTEPNFVLQFNDTLKLVQWRLLTDVSDKFPGVIKDLTDIGGDAVVTRLHPIGQRMFERNSWDKWVN